MIGCEQGGYRVRVLLVESDKILGEGIRMALRGECYTLDWIDDAAEAEQTISCEHFDLLLLDLGLPHRGWLNILRNIRAINDTDAPVLLLTERDAITDRIHGMDVGADDYLIKPFNIDELKARVRTLLRCRKGSVHPLLEHAGVILDPVSEEVRYQGAVVAMTTMEYQLLHQLLARPGVVVTRERLSNGPYSWKDAGQGNTLEVLIYNLRKKIFSEFIRTVRGVGYLLEPQP
jgi:two-component system response regulator QseB